MDTDIEKQIQERIGQLPQDMQDAILSADFETKIQTISHTNNLHIDQMAVVGDETLLVMLGFTNSEDFAQRVAEQVKITPEVAQKIVTEVNTQIFLPIRESMKKFTEGQKEESVSEKSVIMPSSRIVVPPSTPPPAPVVAPAPIPPAIITPPIAPPTPSKPATPPLNPALQAAELMLREKTVSAPPVSIPTTPTPPSAAPVPPKVEPPKPTSYKTDPYREPPEV